MGVDFYGCEACGESRYSEYVGECTDCSCRLCTSCLVNDDIKAEFAHNYGIKYDSTKPELMKELFEVDDLSTLTYIKDGDIIDDSSIQPKYCPFCNGDKVDNDALLTFIVRKYQLDTNAEWKEYKNRLQK